MTGYSALRVPVEGGSLAAGVWNPDAPTTLLAIHGVTANHRCWLTLAEQLPDTRVLAPDLRGRGRSAALPGPFGMLQHARDLVALLDAQSIDRVAVVGHSMGGFVAMAFAWLFPDRVSSVVLIDGGIPLLLPAGVPPDQLIRASLGPAIDRLSMTFESRGAYREFWRAHPAFAGEWGPAIEDYVDYDLVGTAPQLRASANADAVLADSVEQATGTVADEPWRAFNHPTVFLRAPRGMMDAPGGIYDAGVVEHWRLLHPSLEVREVPDVNHYTVVMSVRGAAAIAAAVTSQVEHQHAAGRAT